MKISRRDFSLSSLCATFIGLFRGAEAAAGGVRTYATPAEMYLNGVRHVPLAVACPPAADGGERYAFRWVADADIEACAHFGGLYDPETREVIFTLSRYNYVRKDGRRDHCEVLNFPGRRLKGAFVPSVPMSRSESRRVVRYRDFTRLFKLALPRFRECSAGFRESCEIHLPELYARSVAFIDEPHRYDLGELA